MANSPPVYHNDASDHLRIQPGSLPRPARSGEPAVPYSGDFTLWVKTGQWETVTSSNVEAIAYDLDSKLLKVRYKSGQPWGYETITPEAAQSFYHAGSKGSWLANNVKMPGKGNKGKHRVPAHPL
jgi:hypothetical protein